jgi:phosphatidylglycerol:prolipoprotein diacylglycerol transferase
VLPVLLIAARSPLELVLTASFAVVAAVAAFASSRLRASTNAHGAAMLAAYLCATVAVVLTGHAALGAAPIALSPYAVTLAIAVLTSWALIVPRLRRLFPTSLVVSVIFGGLVVGIIGSRLANVGADLIVSSSARPLFDRRAGLGVFGAFVLDSVFVGLLFRVRFRQYFALDLLDASASVIAYNIGFGRLGCLLYGCCFGRVASPGPFTIAISSFDPSSPAALAHHDHAGASIWATQPMEAAMCFAIALVVELIYRRRPRWARGRGAIIALAAGLYGMGRALFESLRGDSELSIAGRFTVWQLLGALLAVLSALWLAIVALRSSSAPEDLPPVDKTA